MEKHADELSGTGETGENAPNEAKFDGTMNIVQAQEAIQVTPNPAALSGLDKRWASPLLMKTWPWSVSRFPSVLLRESPVLEG